MVCSPLSTIDAAASAPMPDEHRGRNTGASASVSIDQTRAKNLCATSIIQGTRLRGPDNTVNKTTSLASFRRVFHQQCFTADEPNYSLQLALQPVPNCTFDTFQPDDMEKHDLERLICQSVRADAVTSWEPLQSLWSGYGQIWRVRVAGAADTGLVVKHVQPPKTQDQPRGWNTDTSHARKLKSYAVEAAWYRDWSNQLGEDCRVAKCHTVHVDHGEFAFVLEDLDASGYAARGTASGHQSIVTGLRWLARFHTRFVNYVPTELWPTGTYWHLATRPDELDNMSPSDPLRTMAAQIDRRLTECQFPTLVHGDAKIANLCFSSDRSDVAAVDFQYVGGGCAMKDVAYFLGSCLSEPELELHADDLLEQYFAEVRSCLGDEHRGFESECRELYPVAWADFNRFLLGWYPQHEKLHGYSRKMTELALSRL